jgi:hypothetical protein
MPPNRRVEIVVRHRMARARPDQQPHDAIATLRRELR